MVNAKIIQFFENYAQAFSNYNAQAISEHYHFPCTFWHNGNYLFNKNDFIKNLDTLLKKYKKLNFDNASFTIEEIKLFSDALLQVQLRWLLKNINDQIVSEFEVVYNILIKDNRFKIFSVLNLDE